MSLLCKDRPKCVRFWAFRSSWRSTERRIWLALAFRSCKESWACWDMSRWPSWVPWGPNRRFRSIWRRRKRSEPREVSETIARCSLWTSLQTPWGSCSWPRWRNRNWRGHSKSASTAVCLCRRHRRCALADVCRFARHHRFPLSIWLSISFVYLNCVSI